MLFSFPFSPSSLDALVFSYLAPILRVPFPNNDLKDHLKQSENLWLYCSRILQRYFPSSPEGKIQRYWDHNSSGVLFIVIQNIRSIGFSSTLFSIAVRELNFTEQFYFQCNDDVGCMWWFMWISRITMRWASFPCVSVVERWGERMDWCSVNDNVMLFTL